VAAEFIQEHCLRDVRVAEVFDEPIGGSQEPGIAGNDFTEDPVTDMCGSAFFSVHACPVTLPTQN